MSRKLYIAEKRDIAEKLAPCLAALYGGNVEVMSGWIKVGDHALTWFAGHMYEACKPETYGYKFGDLSNMPVIVPENNWQMEVRQGKGDWAAKQVKMIRAMVPEYDIIVNGGDAEREGQLLIDEALDQWGIDPFGHNIMRLWSEDLTAEKLTAAVKSEFLNAEKKTLYNAALARSKADYEWGMSFTGMFTEFVRIAGVENQLISIGRVQMAILRIIADRDRARKEFRPVDHFKPSAKCEHSKGSFGALWKWGNDTPTDEEGRLLERSVVEKLKAKVEGKTGRVTGYTKDAKTTPPPLPFHLASVTIELARKYGFSADKTLKLASKLYLDTYSSYPRGDSRHLTKGVRGEIPEIFENLKEIPVFGAMLKNADLSLKSACWNDSKVKDHHALIPTKNLTLAVWEKLSDDEQKFLIATTSQLIAQFYPHLKYDAVGADIECEGEKFRATGRAVTSKGWKSLFTKDEDEDASDDGSDEPDISVPIMQVGDSVLVQGIDFGATKTKILPRLNDGSLMTLLEAPASLVTDPEMKRKIRDTDGIGRPATRAGILATLFARGYIHRPESEKKSKRKKTEESIELESTDLGYDLIDVLPESLKSIGMTAIWEGRLENIKDGSEDMKSFLDDIENEMRRLTKDFIEKYGKTGLKLKGVKVRQPMKGDGELCSKCGIGHMKTISFPSKKNPKITLRALICDQGRDKCDNFVFEKTFEPLPGDGDTCPKCGQGHLVTIQFPSSKDPKIKKRALVCDRGRTLCDFAKFEGPEIVPMQGDGEKCPKCGKGHLKTIQFPSKKDPKVIKKALICDQDREICGYVKFDEPVVIPMKGDGTVCVKCGVGHMKTISFPSKQNPKIIKKALVCDQPREKCGNIIFEDAGPPVRPLPGDGKVCSKCGTGHMKTYQVPSRKKPGTFVTFLACDRGKNICDNVEFVDTTPPPSPLPGDGKVCPKCKTGHMHTKAIPSKKKPGTKMIVLACDNTACKSLEFPR